MRIMGVIVVLLGLAGIAIGAIFIMQAASAEQEIEVSVNPITLSEVEPKYDAVKAQADMLKMAEEPGIQAQTAQPSPMYNYLSAQRASLGLAKANIGTASFVRTTGIINIILGAGLVLAGVGVMMKARSAG
jgi:hypothetical protein